MGDDTVRDEDPVDAPFDEHEWQRIEDEEVLAKQRRSAIEAGRRKGGVAGAAMAGAMLALSEIYEGPKKDEMVAVSESPDEPGDIDEDGITVTVGDVDVEAKLPDADS
ncbi:hypothetical protein [Ilumatobacter nonamiensis]|uniref:hypothetical protein n=1 Tax=Ilumatobacter nonamiensis TaxID=467093 RepID=UPI000590B742|nr:hypothetical protein [Ilumatobacter nonamiensis]